MGISIGNKYHSIDGSYSMFYHIRKIIAKQLDDEFGDVYADIIYSKTDEEEINYNNKLHSILSADKFNNSNKDILDFLFMSDCDGKINYKTCKKIFELIKNVEDFPIGYANAGQSFNDFKNILLECYSKRMNLIWY